MLTDSMQVIGQLHPIIVRPHQDQHLLVAGRHRYEAALRLQWDTIKASVVSDMDADKALLAEIDENLIRADLSPAEQAAHLAERERLYVGARHGGSRSGAGRPPSTDSNYADPQEANRRKSSGQNVHLNYSFAKDTAEKTGNARRTIDRGIRRGKHIPNVSDLVGTSLDQGNELDALARMEAAFPDAARALRERAVSGEKVSAKTELKKVRRSGREAELAERTMQASEGTGGQLYGVIYADPPWRFKPYSVETGMDRAADNHYPTMTVDDIADIKPPAAPDCALFLWTTSPFLEHALRIMVQWGFQYKTTYYWCKPGPGTGYWSQMDQVETLLVGTRGSVPAPAPGTQPPQYHVTGRQAHSSKPDHFADMIAIMFPTTPKLEMFARRRRDGWTTHGNEL